MYKVTIQTSGQMNQINSGCTTAPLLSDLYIQIPKPQPAKKVATNEPTSLEWIETDNHQKGSDSHCFIFSGTRTKNSSASLPFKSESEIISDWVRSLFQKRGLLGPSWEHKFQLKRKDNLSIAFAALKEYEPPQSSAYLQTQSRYKPPLTRKVNNLLVMGIEKLHEVLPKMQLQRKHHAFSQLLRHLAFQHMNNLTRCRSEQSFSIRSQQISKQMPLSPKTRPFNASREEYELQKKYFQGAPQGRPIQKHIPHFQNQYALNPFSENPKQLEASKAQKSPRSSRYVPLPPSMRQSSNSIRMEIPMKQSFHIRGEHYQEQRNTYDPLRESQQYGGPPSPTNIRFTPISTPQMFFPQSNQQPQLYNPQVNFHPLLRNQPTRPQVRPHTHNPFPNRSTHKDKSQSHKEVEKVPESRSRAVSASPNIKISFIGGTHNSNGHGLLTSKHQKRNLPNDYQGQSMKASKAPKLGTVENKQMRHKYQINSWDNQLVPQDYNRMPNYTPLLSPMTPNPMHSPMTPNYIQSPKQKLVLSPQRTPIAHNGPISPQIAPSSPRVSMNRPSPRVHRQLQPRSPTSNDYNMRRREKLTVTASRRRQ